MKISDVIDPKFQKVPECTIRQAYKYVRHFKNAELKELERLKLLKEEHVKKFSAKEAQKPHYNQLPLKGDNDKYLTEHINHILQDNERASRLSETGPVYEICRIYRDALGCAQSRKDRLLAGVKELLAKSKLNADDKLKGVFL